MQNANSISNSVFARNSLASPIAYTASSQVMQGAGYYVGEDPRRLSLASPSRAEQPPADSVDLYPSGPALSPVCPTPTPTPTPTGSTTTTTMTASLHLLPSPVLVSSTLSSAHPSVRMAPLRAPAPASASAVYLSPPPQPPSNARSRAPRSALDGSPASQQHPTYAPVTHLATTPDSEYRVPPMRQRQSDATAAFALRGAGSSSPGRHSKVISLNDAEPAPNASGQHTPLAHSHSDPADSSAQFAVSTSTSNSAHDYHYLWNTGQAAAGHPTQAAGAARDVVNPSLYTTFSPLALQICANPMPSSELNLNAPMHSPLAAAANSGPQLSSVPVPVPVPVPHMDTAAASSAQSIAAQRSRSPTKTSTSSSANSPQKAPQTERRPSRTAAGAGPSHAHSLQQLQMGTSFESPLSLPAEAAVACASREPRSEKTKRKSPGSGSWRSRSLRFTRNSPTPPSNNSSDRSSPPQDRKEPQAAASLMQRNRKGSLGKRFAQAAFNLFLGKKGNKKVVADEGNQNTQVGSTTNSTVSLNGAIASGAANNGAQQQAAANANANELVKGSDTNSKAQRVEEKSSQKARTECAADGLRRISSTRSNMSQSSNASSASNRKYASHTATPRPQPKPGDSPGDSLRSAAAPAGARAHSPIPFANNAPALSLTNPATTPDLDDPDDDVFLQQHSPVPSGRSPPTRKQTSSPESSQSRLTAHAGSNEKLSSSLSDPKLAPTQQLPPLLSPITEERSPDSRSRYTSTYS